MLAALSRLKRPDAPSRRREPRVPTGVRVYAIGDIHGRADLLDQLLEAIRADSEARDPKRRILVILGDYIDRGPDSAGVLDRLESLRQSDEEAYFILGNHEEAFLRVLGGDEEVMADWLRFGGRECLASYGADPEAIAPGVRPADWLAGIVPHRHRMFLEACEDSVSIGDYLFVHAGIRPGAPLSEQVQHDLRWIREPFLRSTADHGAVVVHGHSISEEVDWRSNRISIDTGAYRSGVLTALVLSGSRRRIVQALGDTR